MCVIIYKPKNVDLPDIETLEDCYIANDDGIGFAYRNDRGKMVLKKGYMDFWEFISDLSEIDAKKNLKKSEMIIHFRLGTHGEVNPAYTHPFPISPRKKDLFRLSGTYNMICAHNGIISGFGDRISDNGKKSRKKPLSDTMDFVLKVVEPTIKYINNPKIVKMYENILDGDRFIIMTEKKTIRLGKWYKHEKCYFSNLNWQWNFEDDFPYNSLKGLQICDYCGTLAETRELNNKQICDSCYNLWFSDTKKKVFTV